FEAGCSWLECGAFPPSLNSTNIALIPKGESQASMKDWRPISLCNVHYKIVAKVLANRLKSILEKCISENQSAFVPGRSILDNAMATIEIIHYMKSKTKVDYSIIVNGNLVGPVVPGRGLRQGDPLSQYLFIICAEGLSALIRQAENRGDLHGIKVCRRAPIISHVLFANDCFLFFKATVNEAIVLKNILSVYEAASGQAINLQKSEFYCSRNVHADLREDIAHQLGVTQVLGTGKYFGLPSMIDISLKQTQKS
ncbi:ribonuclease H, partial [Trifolium pratense]